MRWNLKITSILCLISILPCLAFTEAKKVENAESKKNIQGKPSTPWNSDKTSEKGLLDLVSACEGGDFDACGNFHAGYEKIRLACEKGGKDACDIESNLPSKRQVVFEKLEAKFESKKDAVEDNSKIRSLYWKHCEWDSKKSCLKLAKTYESEKSKDKNGLKNCGAGNLSSGCTAELKASLENKEFTVESINPVGFKPVRVAKGDLNGDGIADLAIVFRVAGITDDEEAPQRVALLTGIIGKDEKYKLWKVGTFFFDSNPRLMDEGGIRTFKIQRGSLSMSHFSAMSIGSWSSSACSVEWTHENEGLRLVKADKWDFHRSTNNGISVKIDYFQGRVEERFDFGRDDIGTSILSSYKLKKTSAILWDENESRCPGLPRDSDAFYVYSVFDEDIPNEKLELPRLERACKAGIYQGCFLAGTIFLGRVGDDQSDDKANNLFVHACELLSQSCKGGVAAACEREKICKPASK